MVSAQILIAAERSGRGQHKSLLAGWSRSRRHGNIGQGCRCDGTELGENFTFQSVKLLSGDSKQKKFPQKKWYFDHNWGVGHFVVGTTQKYHFF